MSFLFTLIFIGGSGELLFSFLLLAFIFVWVRGTLPRFRYDKLIYLAWKSFLPFSLNFLVLVVGIIFLILLSVEY
jgi:NADH-ubiquinone oxidoreductase chain 1